MNLTKSILGLLVGASMFMACSGDDDPKPSVENAKLGFAGKTQLIQPPSSLATNPDENAQMAIGYIAEINALTSYMSMFEAPAGSEKSTTEIVPSGGRTSASGSVVVYTWSDPQFGSIAYQIKDRTTKFSFEVFLKENGQTEWTRYIYAEESKDKSSGMFELYTPFDTSGEVWMRWDWTRSGDNFNFVFETPAFDGGYKVVMNVNAKTNAGSVTEYYGTMKSYELTWTSKGTGTWKQYENGLVVDEGSF